MSDNEADLRIAWCKWCDDLKLAGEGVLAADCQPSDKAEGLRWLTRLTRYGLEAGVEFADRDFPQFYMPTHETVKVMSDNPDAMHWMASICDDAEYVVHGTRGGGPRVMFTTLGQREGGGMVHLNALDTSTLQIQPDGTFTITLSREKREGNWLQLQPGATSLLVRALFSDRRNQSPPSVRIERIGFTGAPAPLDASTMAARLDRARMVALGSVKAINAYTDEMRQKGWINSFGDNPERWGAGDPGAHYLHGTWRLGDGEALVIDIDPGKCGFWNFQINNRWAESLDYLHRPIHLNPVNAKMEPDGKVRAIVCLRNPGKPNWLDTEGHKEGTMLLRCLDSISPPVVSAHVVSIDSLKGAD